MATLTEQIEQLRLQINQVASDERALVKELSESLRQADKQLLQEVRLAAAEHEVRRCTILRELEMLASRIGMLPRLREPRAAIDDTLRHRWLHEPAHRHQPSNYGERGRPSPTAAN
jgi:hypothetical protein